jgi:hypothetical protein
MYEELGRLIEGRATDELSDQLMSLDATLVKAGFTMHREELDLLITSESTIEGDSILQSVVEVLRIAADGVLGTFEIAVTEDIPLKQLTSLIAAIAFYEAGDLDDAIDAIIKLGEPSDDTLREILSLTTEFTSEDYLPYITTVSDNLITKLEKVIAESQASVLQRSELVTVQVELRNKTARETISSDFVTSVENAGIPSGVSMENLYNHYCEHLLQVSVEQAVDDLLYLALISANSNESIADETAFLFEDLFPSVEQNQQANIVLRKRLASLEHLLNLGEDLC